jgi:hypothetical protein
MHGNCGAFVQKLEHRLPSATNHLIRRHGEACAPPSIVPHAGAGVVVEKYFTKLRLVEPNPFIRAAITSLSTVDAPAWAHVTWKRERGQIGELTQRRL